MRGKLLSIILIFILSPIFSQTESNDHKRLVFSDQEEVFSGIALNPANTDVIAVHGMKTCPLFIYNWKEEQVVNKFNIVNWAAGSALQYSNDGKYLLLEKLFYNDWAPNKDKKTEFYIYNPDNGKLVSKFAEYNAMEFMPDSKKIIALTGITLEIWDVESNKKTLSKNIANAGNCVAISPDSKYIAISAKYTKDELKASGKFKKDKDGLKHTEKTKNKVMIFDAATLDEVTTVDSYFDFIYDLSFSDNGEELFCLQIPHLKASTGVDRRQNTIGIILTNDWMPIRKGFVSRAIYQPEYKLTNDRKYFGFISNGGNSGAGMAFAELHVYDFEEAKLFNRFELSHRLIERQNGRLIRTDGRSRFIFLPDNKTAIMTFGNSLVKWSFLK